MVIVADATLEVTDQPRRVILFVDDSGNLGRTYSPSDINMAGPDAITIVDDSVKTPVKFYYAYESAAGDKIYLVLGEVIIDEDSGFKEIYTIDKPTVNLLSL